MSTRCYLYQEISGLTFHFSIAQLFWALYSPGNLALGMSFAFESVSLLVSARPDFISSQTLLFNRCFYQSHWSECSYWETNCSVSCWTRSQSVYWHDQYIIEWTYQFPITITPAKLIKCLQKSFASKAAKSAERGPKNDGQNTPAANQALMAINISFYIILFPFPQPNTPPSPSQAAWPRSQDKATTQREWTGRSKDPQIQGNTPQNTSPPEQTHRRTPASIRRTKSPTRSMKTRLIKESPCGNQRCRSESTRISKKWKLHFL